MGRNIWYTFVMSFSDALFGEAQRAFNQARNTFTKLSPERRSPESANEITLKPDDTVVIGRDPTEGKPENVQFKYLQVEPKNTGLSRRAVGIHFQEVTIPATQTSQEEKVSLLIPIPLTENNDVTMFFMDKRARRDAKEGGDYIKLDLNEILRNSGKNAIAEKLDELARDGIYDPDSVRIQITTKTVPPERFEILIASRSNGDTEKGSSSEMKLRFSKDTLRFSRSPGDELWSPETSPASSKVLRPSHPRN